MAETREYWDPTLGQHGAYRTIKLYRHRGTWAWRTVGGFMWCRQWGFRSKLAALRSAGRFYRHCQLVPKRGGA